MSHQTYPSMDLICNRTRPLTGFVNFNGRNNSSGVPPSLQRPFDCGDPPPLYSPLEDVESFPKFHFKNSQYVDNYVGCHDSDEFGNRFSERSQCSPRCMTSPPSAVRHHSLPSLRNLPSPSRDEGQRRSLSSSYNENCTALDLSLKKTSQNAPVVQEARSEDASIRLEPLLSPVSHKGNTRVSETINAVSFALSSMVSGRPPQSQPSHIVPANLRTCDDIHSRSINQVTEVKTFSGSWSQCVAVGRFHDERECNRDKSDGCHNEVSKNQVALLIGNDSRCHPERFGSRESEAWTTRQCASYDSTSGPYSKLCDYDSQDKTYPYNGGGADNTFSNEKYFNKGNIAFEASVSWRVQPVPSSREANDVQILSAHTVSVSHHKQQSVSSHWPPLPPLTTAELAYGGAACDSEDQQEEARSPCSGAPNFNTNYKKYLANRYLDACEQSNDGRGREAAAQALLSMDSPSTGTEAKTFLQGILHHEQRHQHQQTSSSSSHLQHHHHASLPPSPDSGLDSELDSSSVEDSKHRRHGVTNSSQSSEAFVPPFCQPPPAHQPLPVHFNTATHVAMRPDHYDSSPAITPLTSLIHSKGEPSSHPTSNGSSSGQKNVNSSGSVSSGQLKAFSHPTQLEPLARSDKPKAKKGRKSKFPDCSFTSPPKRKRE
ncbi:ETS-related transcription factor Elf-2-like isoform X4, partial [Elysia marginata]